MYQASTAGRQGIAAMSSSRSAIQIHGDLLAAACRWVANRLDLHLVPITLQLGRLSCCYKKRLVGLALQCGRAGSSISSLNGVKFVACSSAKFSKLQMTFFRRLGRTTRYLQA